MYPSKGRLRTSGFPLNPRFKTDSWSGILWYPICRQLLRHLFSYRWKPFGHTASESELSSKNWLEPKTIFLIIDFGGKILIFHQFATLTMQARKFPLTTTSKWFSAQATHRTDSISGSPSFAEKKFFYILLYNIW